MAKLLKLRRGSTSQHGSFTGAEGEVTVDTTKKTLVVHDGSSQPGHTLLREDMSNLPAGTIDNADINVSAGISGTKISPDFGSQNITTTGDLNGKDLILTDIAPEIKFVDNNNNPDYSLVVNSGQFRIKDETNNAIRFLINDDGHIDLNTNCDFGDGIDVTGNITATGTITSNDITISDTNPKINLTDSDHNPDYAIQCNSGVFAITDATSNTDRIRINSDGHIDLKTNVDCEAGLDVTGNITVTGTVDGVDVGALNTAVSGLSSGSAALTNGVTATTQGASDNTTKVATTAYVTTAISNLINGAPGSLDTLNELAAAMSDDAAFSTTVTNSLATKLPLAGGQMTGNITFSGSQTVDGRDLSADGSKLDGIESNATQDMSANEILTAVKTVDGSGSGLDADTLDGVQAGGFLRADTADTATADITFSGGAGAVSVSADSDIRIDGGSWTGEYTTGIKIQPNGTDSYFQYEGQAHFRNTSGNNRLSLDQSGNLTAVGNVTAYSDARLKTNVNTINDALSIVGKLRGVSFDWKETGKHSIGVIAQEVEEVIPEVVLTKLDPNPATGEETEIKSVDYGKIVGVLINAINELKAEVDELKVFLLGEELGGK